jgi:protein-tyrosine phosphatase
LGGASLTALMTDSYAQMITLPSARASYRRLFRGLLGAEATPALFHCTTGKDRTGWAAASLLSVLGVPRAAVYEEYLLTNTQLVPALEPVLVAFEHAGGERAVLLAVLGVDRSYLERAFAEVDATYGGIEGYFADGLGLGRDEQRELRARYLEDS